MQISSKNMGAQTECHPDEFRILQLSVDPSGGQTLFELPGCACNLYRDSNSVFDDRASEISQITGWKVKKPYNIAVHDR